jgi:hypothetical protein
MAKRILLGLLGVVLGFIAGAVVMTVLHMASGLVYPPPEGLDMWSQEPEQLERMREWFSTLPAGAFLLAILVHGLGCMGGAVVAMLIAGRRSLWPAVIVGVLFTAAGVINLTSIPHPSWFPYVDLPVYMVLALVAGVLLRRSEA